jgi:hypothetical protein
MVVELDLTGRVSIRCWSATCSEQACLEALGIERETLYPRREPARGRVTFATEVHAEPVRWLVPGRIPLGGVSLLAGDPKLGKSTLSCTYAAGVTLGKFGDPPATVAAAVAADLARLGKFEVIDCEGARYPDLPQDVSQLDAAVAEHDARLVIVDPLNAFLSGEIDSWKDHGVRRALAPLARMAEELGCAVLVIVHLNKQRGGEPLYRIGGSIGQVAAARSVLGFGRDPEDPHEDRGNRRLLGHLASNWGALAPTQLFELETVGLEIDDEWIETSRLIYRGETDQSAADAFGARARDDRGEDCEEAILEALHDGKPHPSRKVKSVVIEELSVSASTVERAAKRLIERRKIVVLERSSSGQGGARRHTEWQLRAEVTSDPNAIRDVTSDSALQRQIPVSDLRSRHGAGNDATSDATSEAVPEESLEAKVNLLLAREEGDA